MCDKRINVSQTVTAGASTAPRVGPGVKDEVGLKININVQYFWVFAKFQEVSDKKAEE